MPELFLFVFPFTHVFSQQFKDGSILLSNKLDYLNFKLLMLFLRNAHWSNSQLSSNSGSRQTSACTQEEIDCIPNPLDFLQEKVPEIFPQKKVRNDSQKLHIQCTCTCLARPTLCTSGSWSGAQLSPSWNMIYCTCNSKQ